MPRRTTQDILDDIADASGAERVVVSTGSTEPRAFFEDVATRVGISPLDYSTKIKLVTAIAEAGGEIWLPEYDSSQTKSKGGGTIKNAGLEAILRALGKIGPASTALDQHAVIVPYRPVDETFQSAPMEPFATDPDAIDRANLAHRTTQTLVAEWACLKGFEAVSPGPGGPQFDVGWRSSDGLFVVEVKSLSTTNEDLQLRLAIGQILDYCQQLSALHEVVQGAGVVTSQEPQSPRWRSTLAHHGLTLAWPGMLDHLLDHA